MSPIPGDRPRKTRTQANRPPGTPVAAYGCLVVAIMAAVLVVGLAVIFLWDVNQPH
jgi:hypothetical protein